MVRKGQHRYYVYIMIILILFSTIFSIFAGVFHGEVKIGIILTEECEPRFGEYAREIFEEYGEFFSAEIIDERMNISSFIPVNDHYVCEDFNDPQYTRMIRAKYDVDYILIIITHYLTDGIEEPYVLCGKADTESSSAVMTVLKFNPGREFVGTEEQRICAERNFTQHVALHEVAHLLGYKHDFYDKECVMKYEGVTSEFCFEHSFELPYRTMLSGLSSGVENSWGVFLISTVIALIFLPSLVAFAMLVHFLFLKYIYEKDRYPWQVIGANSSFAFFILMISNTILMGIFAAIVFSVAIECVFYLWHVYSTNKKDEVEE